MSYAVSIHTWLQESVGKRISLCNSVESQCLCGGITQKKSTTETTEIAQRSTESIFSTDSFSQVSRNSKLNGNRLNGFQSKGRSVVTWLKPGVNEKEK